MFAAMMRLVTEYPVVAMQLLEGVSVPMEEYTIHPPNGVIGSAFVYAATHDLLHIGGKDVAEYTLEYQDGTYEVIDTTELLERLSYTTHIDDG